MKGGYDNDITQLHSVFIQTLDNSLITSSFKFKLREKMAAAKT